MAFTYKTIDRTAALDQPVGGTSLYELARFNNKVFAKLENHFTTYRDERSKHTTREDGVEYLSVLALFNNLLADKDSDLDDDNIIKELYADQNAGVRQVNGNQSEQQCKTSLARCVVATAGAYRATLEALQNSFKQTYQHNDIAALLGTTKVVSKPGLVKSRVFETAYILDRILDKKRFLATSLLLGIMHVQRFGVHQDATKTRKLYNQGSVLFTLLTFSYTPSLWIEDDSARCTRRAKRFREVAKDAGDDKEKASAALRGAFHADWVRELTANGSASLEKGAKSQLARVESNEKILAALQHADVHFGWKMLGSCLGIDAALLPDTHAEAKQLWDAFTGAGYRHRVSTAEQISRAPMIETFNDALELKDKWDQMDAISFGLTLKASAITESWHIGPVARILGWYTSSNNAGATCSKCKTAHGSRVSLIRPWHRCSNSKCQKIYCPSCALGMKQYVAIATGVVVASVTWWWGVASALYSAAAGVIVGSGSTRLTAFAAAECSCGSATEVLS